MLKKILFAAIVSVMLFAPVSFAEWNPTPLEITVRGDVISQFDGTDTDIPVDVAGKPCRAYLWINTRLDDADKPQNLRNGYLGWHYVNGIDTTVYISGAKDFEIGDGNKFTWDGIGSENTSKEYMGTIEPSQRIPLGVYDYYVFGYDDENPRERVCNFICISYYWNPQYVRIGEYHNDGTPRSQPLLYGNTNSYSQDLHALKDVSGKVIGNAEGWESHGPPLNTAFKFPIGSGPDDMSAMQTTVIPGLSGAAGEELLVSPVIFDPTDESMFYSFHEDVGQKNGTLFRWDWIEGGNAELEDDWGGWNDVTVPTASDPGKDRYGVATSTDGDYIYLAAPGSDPETGMNKFYMVDFDAELRGEITLDDFYTPDHPNENYRNGNANKMFTSISYSYQAIVGGEQSCLMMMIDTNRLKHGDTDGYIKWTNGNGDYFLDASWDPETTDPATLWECNYETDKTPNMSLLSEHSFDSNGIIVRHMDYNGITSFVVYTQDGSGIAYGRFYDDNVFALIDLSPKPIGSGQICDTGSMYDGLYRGLDINILIRSTDTHRELECVNWYAMDSAHGIISHRVHTVNVETPKAFSVDVPYPNPANPSTTIGFTLVESGNVSIDIYNIAGQKIDTLTNSEFAPGKHTAVWDGAAYSAGVYFCTVRSGRMSETRKMVLVK